MVESRNDNSERPGYAPTTSLYLSRHDDDDESKPVRPCQEKRVFGKHIDIEGLGVELFKAISILLLLDWLLDGPSRYLLPSS